MALDTLRRLHRKGEPLYLILDDTQTLKRAKKMEAVGRLYHHADKTYRTGHTILKASLYYRGVTMPWASCLYVKKEGACPIASWRLDGDSLFPKLAGLAFPGNSFAFLRGVEIALEHPQLLATHDPPERLLRRQQRRRRPTHPPSNPSSRDGPDPFSGRRLSSATR